MAPTRGVRDLRPYESDLIRQGFKKGTNSLGVTYYAEGPSWGNHGKPEYGWVEASDGSGKWTRVPWHLIENPYDGGGGNPSGPTREVDTGQPGREMTAAALGESVPILYGEVLLGGDVFFQRVAGNAYWASYGISQGSDFGCGGVQGIFAQVGESALYPIASQGFYGIYWEDKPGTLTQTASTFMQEGLTNSGSGTIQEQVYPGLAYVAVKQISGYTPSEPKFLYRGLKVYDPRLDATLASIGPTRNSTTVVWSDNDALCLADYLQADYGAGYGMSGVDWDSVIEAANYCDVDVGAGQVTDCIVGSMGQLTPTQMLATTCTFTAAPGGGVTATGTPVFRAQTINDFTYYELIGITITNPGSGYLVAPSVTFTFGAGWNNQCTISSTVLGERRHRMNILLRRPASVKSTIETLRQHFRCYLRERAGKVVFLIDKPRASVYTLTKDTARPLSGGRKGSSSVPNGGILNFTNRNKSWQQDEFRVETENVKFGIEEFRPAEWSLLGITRQNEIGRQGSYLVGKERLNLNSGLEIMTSDGFQFEKYDRVTYVEDVLALDSPGVDFVINSIEDDSEGKFVAKISLYDEAIYVDTVGVVEVAPPVNIQNP